MTTPTARQDRANLLRPQLGRTRFVVGAVLTLLTLLVALWSQQFELMLLALTVTMIGSGLLMLHPRTADYGRGSASVVVLALVCLIAIVTVGLGSANS